MSDQPAYGVARGLGVLFGALAVAAALMLALDLVFLGVLARPFYDQALGELRAPEVYWPAALTFYVFYVGAIVSVAVLPTRSTSAAAWRGAGLGLFAYGVYELTNLAVIAGWPASLVPVDVGWGVVLTATVAAGAHRAVRRHLPPDEDWMAPFEIQRLPDEGWAMVWGRRAVTVTAVFALLALLFAGAVLWLSLALFSDVTLGPRGRWTKVRALLFFALYLLCECFGLLAAAGLWAITLGGRLVSGARYLDYHVALQGRWASALFFGSLRIFSMRLETHGLEHGARGPYVLWVRHVSTSDTVLAAATLTLPHGLQLRYVMKDALLWDPCIDVVGRRLPNAFVARASGDASGAIAAIERLASGLDPRSAVLIFPEGTRSSPARRERALAHLEARGDDTLAALAAEMQYVLPPRLGGILALMKAAPHLDVVLLAHTGLEGARSFREFISGGLVGRTVEVAVWRISPPELEPEARARWVFEQWQRVDAWVAEHAGKAQS